MFDLDGLNAEISQLKAQTLSEYGKKIEFAIEMMNSKISYLEREKKIVFRLRNEVKFNLGFLKKRRYATLIERLEKKISKTESEIERLKGLKEKYIDDYKRQREYLGIYDHEFIDNYFK
ncbi:MAG: hypothetical protein LDL13_08900 [Calditerrivibrio sp.]|nr:hypothetical protein [Calditerrivibrio sp.]MCA1933683.1 hypothetical protein [Calditerrivibrio sp.]MCA1980575.1 hypothetical protein [Calditerrivibrio sp.]